MALFVRIAAAPNRSVITRALSQVHKSVFISQSNDPATNQALEEWLHTRMDFNDHHVMLVYRNDACVSVGRHQNPWLETSVNNVTDESEDVSPLPLLRRLGGGNASYIDQGTLNVTFFTPRGDLRPEYSYGMITRALFREYGLKLDVASLEEPTAHKMKILGSSTRIGQTAASLSCFLHVDVNKQEIANALQKSETYVETKALKSPNCTNYLNLCEINPRISVDGLMTALGSEFLRTIGTSLHDGGRVQASKQRGYQMLNPTDNWFPGMNSIRDELTSWQWTHGSTPDFTLSRPFTLPSHLYSHPDRSEPTHDMAARLSVRVTRGLVADVHVHMPAGAMGGAQAAPAELLTEFRGQRFTEQMLPKLEYCVTGGRPQRAARDAGDVAQKAAMSSVM